MEKYLFRLNLDIKELKEYMSYERFESRLKELGKRIDLKELGKFERMYVTRNGNEERVESKSWKIYGVYAGNPFAENRIAIIAGHHGEEPAGDVGALKIIEELANPTPQLQDVLKEAYVLVIPSIDPEGYSFRARKEVGRDGLSDIDARELKRYKIDQNGCWGLKNGKNISEEIKIVKRAIDEFNPKLAIDLHETPYTKDVPKDTYNMLHGNRQGLMIIQHLPKGEESTGEEILAHIRERVYRTYKASLLMKLLMPLQALPQTIPLNKDYSLQQEGPLLTDLGIKVFGAYVRDRGAEAYTFETFENFFDERVGEHIAGVEGAIQSFLKKRKQPLHKN